MSNKKLNCLRCKGEMQYASTENLQLGKTGWLMGDLPNLIAGALTVDIYTCPRCGKIEFFSSAEEDKLPSVTCPKCGKEHDFDYPKCPYCNHSY